MLVLEVAENGQIGQVGALAVQLADQVYSIVPLLINFSGSYWFDSQVKNREIENVKLTNHVPAVNKRNLTARPSLAPHGQNGPSGVSVRKCVEVDPPPGLDNVQLTEDAREKRHKIKLVIHNRVVQIGQNGHHVL